MNKNFLAVMRSDGLKLLINLSCIKSIRPYMGKREDDGKYSVVCTERNEELIIKGNIDLLEKNNQSGASLWLK